MSSGELQDFRVAATLVSSLALARTIGSWTWLHNGRSHLGEVAVSTNVAGASATRLRMTVHELRPSEPRLQYLATEGWIRRLCLNRPHRPIHGTHKHRVGAEGETAYEPVDIPIPPLAPRVQHGTLYGILAAFAGECMIELSDDLDWSPPWKGV